MSNKTIKIRSSSCCGVGAGAVAGPSDGESSNGGSADWPLLFMGISGMWTRTTLAKNIKSGEKCEDPEEACGSTQGPESPLC